VEIDGDHLALLDEAVAGTAVPLTFFEVSAVLAFLAFAEAKVDVAILETGLGGRLDATSVCHPLACAITSIALDHEAILGNTIVAIAYEKACIAKPGIPLFLGPLFPEADKRIAEVALAVGAPVHRAGIDYPPAPAAPALLGRHQLANAALAVALARLAAQSLGRPLDDGDVLRGLSEVRWPGRLERMADDVLLDCAHNVEGAQALVAALPPAPPEPAKVPPEPPASEVSPPAPLPPVSCCPPEPLAAVVDPPLPRVATVVPPEPFARGASWFAPTPPPFPTVPLGNPCLSVVHAEPAKAIDSAVARKTWVSCHRARNLRVCMKSLREKTVSRTARHSPRSPHFSIVIL